MKFILKIFTALALAAFSIGCATVSQTNSANNSQAQETPAPTVDPNKKRTFEDDVAGVRYNNYKFIFVLRRKDGQPMNAEDGQYLRAYTRSETNQRLMADEGKALIIGSNFRFYAGQFDALNRRFDFQDLSEEKYQKNENDDEAPTPVVKETPVGKKPAEQPGANKKP